ncbi:MAG: helix-turn-helix domain-containing protein [Chloroflexi bacterium]|nr:helix-turn-helix domain-containing protein [Chloroflexota bacterium]
MPNNLHELLQIKNRIMGVLLRDAREHAGYTYEQAAGTLGLTPEDYYRFELGQVSPTLPQLEVLSYAFNVPISHFWGGETLDETRPDPRSLAQRLPELLMLRTRMIGVRLRQLREYANLTLEEVSERTGFPVQGLAAVESGVASPPIAELEMLVRGVNARLEDLIDGSGRVGNWIQLQEEYDRFAELPADLRTFVVNPTNRSYIELAMRLSHMEVNQLRTIAESILEITF